MPSKRCVVIALCLLPGLSWGANHQVTVSNFQFSPESLTIEAGDTVTWTNQSGSHNVVADDNSFRCANGCDATGGNGDVSSSWSFTLPFNEVGDNPYYCFAHGDPGGVGMSGVVSVVADTPPPEPEFNINRGINGSWFDVNKPKARQGFIFEVLEFVPPDDVILDPPPPDQLNFFWFTYALNPGAKAVDGGPATERWFNGLGPITGDSATVDVIRCAGGVFDDPEAANCTTGEEPTGTATITFSGCSAAEVVYSLDLDANPATPEITGTVPIIPLNGDRSVCESLSAAAAQ